MDDALDVLVSSQVTTYLACLDKMSERIVRTTSRTGSNPSRDGVTVIKRATGTLPIGDKSRIDHNTAGTRSCESTVRLLGLDANVS